MCPLQICVFLSLASIVFPIFMHEVVQNKSFVSKLHFTNYTNTVIKENTYVCTHTPTYTHIRTSVFPLPLLNSVVLALLKI